MSLIADNLTFAEARELCDAQNARSKAYWGANPLVEKRFGSNEYEERRKDPEVPSDGYGIRFRGMYSINTEEAGIALCSPCVLAGDGRLRDENDQVVYATQEELEGENWSVVECDYNLW